MEEENQKSSTLVEQQQPDENESGCDASQAESNPHLDNSEPAIDDKQMTEAASIDKAISDDSEKSPSLSDENQTSEVEPAMQGTLQTAEVPSVQSPPAPEAFPVQDKMEAASEVPAIQQETNINAAVDGSPAQTPSEPETASVSQHPDSEPAVKAIVVPAKLDDCESAASEAIYEGFEDPPAMSNVHQAPDDIQETSPVGKVSPDPQQSDHIEDALPTQSKSVKEAIPAHQQPETGEQSFASFCQSQSANETLVSSRFQQQRPAGSSRLANIFKRPSTRGSDQFVPREDPESLRRAGLEV